jgi:hypothetical protein
MANTALPVVLKSSRSNRMIGAVTAVRASRAAAGPEQWLPGIRRRLSILLLVAMAAISSAQAADALYEGFRNPGPRYRPMPVWYWNSEIRGTEAKRQIDQYVAQGAQGAIIYPDIGLRTPFLSEAWWAVWAEILPYARQRNFKLGWVPEFNDPDGDARDPWMDPPDQSRVLAGHPEYRLKRLAYVERHFRGPGTARFDHLPDPVIAVAARSTEPDALDADTLVDLSASIHGQSFQTDFGPGDWLLVFYHVVASEGYKGVTRVDPLNREATLRYIDLTLGEFDRRFKGHVGSTLNFIMLDSEGSFGGPIVWTPGFFEIFLRRKHYDIRRLLPVLSHDGGAVTPKIRNDYFDVVSELFVQNFWKPVADWGRAHRVEVVGQNLGDGLQLDPAFGGDFMVVQRAMTMPFLEEEESGASQTFRDPRQFKEPASVAHFENLRLGCECLLVQGAGTYVSPQKMRMGTNVLAAWGVNFWNQNTSYDEKNAEWPPMMGASQPHWKYFHRYADLIRRISYMNDGGRHVADVLLYRPIASVVAFSDPAFDSTLRHWKGRARGGYAEYGNRQYGRIAIRPYLAWGGDFSWQAEMDYHGLMNLLVQRQKDFDILDDHYLVRATIGSGSIELGPERFGVIVLPAMKVIARAALARIRRFYEQGGTVVAYGSLPSGSTDEGWNDPQVADSIRAIFGVAPDAGQDTSSRNAQGGQSFFIAGDLERVAATIDRARLADFQVVEGSAERLFYLHRVKDGRDLYWIANDDPAARKLVLSLAASGAPELWDPDRGTRRVLPYTVRDGRTVLAVELGPWDGAYVVFRPATGQPAVSISDTNLERYTLDQSRGDLRLKGRVSAGVPRIYAAGDAAGRPFRIERPNPSPAQPQVLPADDWDFRVTGERVKVHYAREALLPGHYPDAASRAFNDQSWRLSWLAAERFTMRDWELIGPFPNPDHEGFNRVYPPEQKFDREGRYPGLEGTNLAWYYYRSSNPEVNVTEALNIPNHADVAYAHTYVYSPEERQVKAVLAAENPKLWVNGRLVFQLHPMPRYYELRDGFAFKSAITLLSGWNEILIKLEHDRLSGALFSFRLADSAGLPVAGLLVSVRRGDPQKLRAEAEREVTGRERWYRISIPPGTRALRLPKSPAIKAIYVNGKAVDAQSGRVPFSPLDWGAPNVVALVMQGSDELIDYPVFEPGTTRYKLGSWSGTGLGSFSGEAIYERRFRVEPSLIGKRIELDCGEVGHTAEVWVNDKHIDDRTWAPFRFDITAYLRPGENRMRIAVTNSDANERAEADPERYMYRKALPGGRALPLLETLTLNGLLGPVRLVPYLDVELPLQQELSP